MADASRVIELIFAATDQTGSALNSMSSGIDAFNDKVSAVAEPIANATEKLLKFEAAGALAAAALVGLSLKGAVDFQSSLLDLQKVLDATDGNVQQFAGTAVDLSNKYGEAATSVLGSAANFKQAGFTAKESFELAELAIQAVKITEFDATEASQAFIQALKGFGAPVSDAARILDVLNEVSNVYAVDSKQLGDALARIAPIAKQTGFSIEEITAVLTPGIEVFQDGEIVARAFVTTLQRLVSDNKNVTKALDSLGVAQKDANGHFRSGKDILHDIQIAYQTLDPAVKLHTASQIAGIDQAAKAVIVFDGLAKTTAVLATANGAAGSAARELEIRMGAAKEQGERVIAVFQNASILFGGTLLANFQGVEKAAISLGLALQQMVQVGAFGGLSDLINGAETSLANFIQTLANNLPLAFAQLDFTGLNSQIDLLGTSLGGLFTGIDLTTPEGLRQSMQAIIDLGSSFVAFNRGLVDGFTEIKNAFTFLTGSFGLGHESAAALLGQLGAFSIVFVALSPAITLVSASFTLLAGSMSLLAGLPVLISGISAALIALQASNPVGLALFAAAATAAALAGSGLIPTLVEGTKHLFGFGAAAQAAINPTAGLAAQLAIQAGTFPLLKTAIESHTVSTDKLAGISFKLSSEFALQTDAGRALTAQIQELFEKNQSLASELSPEAQALSEMTAQLDAQKTPAQQAAEQIDLYLGKVRELGGVQPDVTLAGDLAAKGYKEQTIAVTDLKTGIVTYTQALTFSGEAAKSATDKAAEGLSKTAKEALKAQQEADKFNLEWEKVQSQEQVAIFKLQADIDIAAIQAGTEQIKAAFDSVNTTVKSTGDTISSLVHDLASVGTAGGAGQEIIHLLEEENRRRQEALDLQKGLVEAQIAYLNAVVDRLSGGEAFISVTADGLEPELEAFMFKILERIQVRASGEAQQFLLGLQ